MAEAGPAGACDEQGRYDDELEELGLDRTAWCLRAEALIEHVQGLLG